MPKVITLAQRTDEWLAWRSTGIGGSDASAIMYESPYMSPYALWAQKVGKRAPKKVNKAMQRGMDLEMQAVIELSKHLGEFLPSACLQHDEHPFMLTSLDGYAPPDMAAEVKVPTSANVHLLAREGQVPRVYYAQCQHNLYVSGVETLYFASYYPKDERMPLAVVPVKRDEAYLKELIEAEREFWRWVEEKRFPEYQGEKDLGADKEWADLSAALWEAAQMKKVAEDRHDSIRAEMARIAARARSKAVRGAGVLATWVHTRERTQVMPESIYLRIGHSAEEASE